MCEAYPLVIHTPTLTLEQAQQKATEICDREMYNWQRDKTGLTKICEQVFTELVQTAPEWTEKRKDIEKIVRALEMRRENPWPGLESLNGQKFEYEQVVAEAEDQSFQDTVVPLEVRDWLRRQEWGEHEILNSSGIRNDRTHVEVTTYFPDNSGNYTDGRTSRVSVSKLLDRFHAPPDIRKLMTKLSQKPGTDRIQVEISTDPVDILRKSTGQFWTSCEACGGKGGTDYSGGNFSDIENKNAIAIIRKNKDIDTHGKWAGRFMLRSCKDDKGKVNVGIEERVYGGEELETTVIREAKDFLEKKSLLGYGYCYTPYEYQGHSDTKGGGGVLVWGDDYGAMLSVAKDKIEETKKEYDHVGVCKNHNFEMDGFEPPYFTINLAELYEKKVNKLVEDYADDPGAAIRKLVTTPFDDIAECELEYDLEDYQKWQRAEHQFKTTMAKLKDAFKNELYLVGWKTDDIHFPNGKYMLFAPACEGQYNMSKYTQWDWKLEKVELLLDHLKFVADRDLRETMKKNIIFFLNPWRQESNPMIELLDEERAKGEFNSYDMYELCDDILTEDDGDEPGSNSRTLGHGRTYVGYTEWGMCPIEDNKALDTMVQRCDIRRKLRIGRNNTGDTRPMSEIFTSLDEVGSIYQPIPPLKVRPLDPNLTSAEARENYRKYLEEHPGQGPPREMFPGPPPEDWVPMSRARFVALTSQKITDGEITLEKGQQLIRDYDMGE